MSNAQYVCISPGGDITVTASGITRFGEGHATSVDVEHYSYCWRPPGSLRRYLPDGFHIEFECYEAADGTRRFVPAGGYESFIHLAFLAGLAVLFHQRKISFATWRRYAKQHLVFQLVRGMREHLSREFHWTHDLYVRARGRGGGIGGNLLRSDLTFDVWQHSPASVDVVMREGRELALAEGIVKPKERTALHYGLFEAARRNARRVPDRQTRALLRLALFDISAGEFPSREALRHVRSRVLDWIDDHGQDSTEQFTLRFFPGRSNFVKAIADQRDRPGGRLEYGLVRQAILQFGWESYLVVGRCIEAFMRWFEDCLPQPVKRAERRLLRDMYFRRPYFGSLPLVLFLERGGFVQKAITELWENPGDELAIGTVHRLIELYGQLIVMRREADRRSKKPSANNDSANMEVTGNDLAASPSEPSRTMDSVYDEIAEYLAERGGLQCRNCGGHWRSHLAQEFRARTLPDPVALTVKCGCEQVVRPFSLPLEQFRAIAAEFMDD